MAGAVVLASDPINVGPLHTSAEVFAAWGQVAGAAFTAAAVIVALWVAFRDRRRYDRERREAATRQARLLFIETVPVNDQYMKIVLHNRSDGYFYMVDIDSLRALSGDQEALWANTSKYRFQGQEVGYPDIVGDLAPGSKWESDLISFGWKRKPRPSVPECSFYVNVTFLDARGELWTRLNGHEPHRVPESETQGRLDLAMRRIEYRVNKKLGLADPDDEED